MCGQEIGCSVIVKTENSVCVSSSFVNSLSAHA